MDFMTYYKQLNNNQLSQMTWISGEETYLIDNLIKHITERFLNTDYATFNLTIVDNAPDMDAVIGTAMTLPFFDARRLIVFSNTGVLKNLKEDAESKLLSFIQAPPAHAVLIFVENDVDKRKKLYKALSKSADVVEVSRLNRSELVKWVGKRFKLYGKEISLHAVNYLIEMLNYLEPEANKNLYDVDNTLKMLSGITEEITESVINQYVEVPIEHNIFKMVDAMSGRHMSEAIKILNHFVQAGEPEIKIFFMINQQFRNIYKTKLLLEEGHTSATIATKLDIHPFVAKKAGSFATQFSVKQLAEIIEILETVDMDMKSSGIDPLLLMEKAMFQISTVQK